MGDRMTDREIKAAVAKVGLPNAKPIEMKDAGDRGAGRLTLAIRQMAPSKKGMAKDPTAPGRVVAEWYAVYYRAGKRRLDKIGSYPTVSLADARKTFASDFIPAITAGEDPKTVHARKRIRPDGFGTVREMFESYVENLRKNGAAASTLRVVDRMLLAERNTRKRRGGRATVDSAMATLGADRAACEIEPEDIVRHLSAIYERGSVGMAHQVRRYLAAAFNFAMKSAHDYTRKNSALRWNLKSNPVSAVPVDASATHVGERFLSPSEYRALWIWLIPYDTNSKVASAIRLQMATGQRVEEILKLKVTSWDKQEQMLLWGPKETKNGLPHSIPLARQAVPVLEGLIANGSGLYFPVRTRPNEPMSYKTVGAACRAYIKATGAAHFTPRNLRRTWKTLSGRAGISKEWCDRLQNHALGDVASKHYDRYDYLPERRAAVATWEAFLERILAGELDEKAEQAAKAA